MPQPCLDVLETLLVFGAGGMTRAHLAAALDLLEDDATLAATLSTCEMWAIAWEVDGRIWVPGALRTLCPSPLQLGPPVERLPGIPDRRRTGRPRPGARPLGRAQEGPAQGRVAGDARPLLRRRRRGPCDCCAGAGQAARTGPVRGRARADPGRPAGVLLLRPAGSVDRLAADARLGDHRLAADLDPARGRHRAARRGLAPDARETAAGDPDGPGQGRSRTRSRRMRRPRPASRSISSAR